MRLIHDTWMQFAGDSNRWREWLQWQWRHQFSLHWVGDLIHSLYACFLFGWFYKLAIGIVRTGLWILFSWNFHSSFASNLNVRQELSSLCWTRCSFTLSGKVLGGVGGPSCACQEEGPAGVKLTLTPVEGGEPVASVWTGAGGSYKFENLLTGSGFLQKSPFGNLLWMHYLCSYSLYSPHDILAVGLFASMDVQSLVSFMEPSHDTMLAS